MKKSIFAKIGAAAVVLTLVTSSLVGGTFAKYTSSVTGQATATAAKWSVAFTKEDTNAFTGTADIKLEGKGADKKVIPGDSGSFKININGDGTEVGFDYKVLIAADGGNDALTGVKFYKDAAHTTEITADGLTGEVAYSVTAGDMNVAEDIYWVLPDGGEGVDDAANMAGKTGTFTITMTAVQNPDAGTPSGN